MLAFLIRAATAKVVVFIEQHSQDARRLRWLSFNSLRDFVFISKNTWTRRKCRVYGARQNTNLNF